MPQTVRSPPQNTHKNLSPPHYGSNPEIHSDNQHFLDRDELLNITKRLKRKCTETPSSSDYCVESKIDDLRAHQESNFDILTNALTILIEQNKEIKSSVDFMSAKYDSLLAKVDSLEKENLNYRTQIQSLEDKLELLEKNTKSTSLEIRNIPRKDQENKQHLINTLKSITTVVGSSPSLHELEVRNIYRTKSSSIVVDFTTSDRKENLLFKYREYNKTKRSTNESQLNTHNLDLPGIAKPIFISDHLTNKTRYIFFLAREQVKAKKLVAAWTSYGKVYVKSSEDGSPTRITSEQDLQKLLL